MWASKTAFPLSGRQTCLVITSVLLVLLPFISIVHAATPPPAVRCLRPFSAMDSFVAVAKADATQNCNFHYFTVTAATAELRCSTIAAAGTSTEKDAASSGLSSTPARLADAEAATSCNVTLRWSMRRADNVVQLLQRQVGTDADYFAQNTTANTSPQAKQQQQQHRGRDRAFLTEDEDVWRYALSLRAKGDSTVQYKGFHGGDGYSMCCDCLVEGSCAWMTAEQGDSDLAVDEEVGDGGALQQSRVVRGCPLPFPSPLTRDGTIDEDDEDGAFGAALGARVALTDLDDDAEGGEAEEGVFHGEITKPLHRLVEGPWEATVQMWRRRQRVPRSDDSTVPVDSGVEAEVLGRVVVPFHFTMAELEKEGRVQRVSSMALTVEDVAEVSPAAAVHAGSSTEDDRSDL